MPSVLGPIVSRVSSLKVQGALRARMVDMHILVIGLPNMPTLGLRSPGGL